MSNRRQLNEIITTFSNEQGFVDMMNEFGINQVAMDRIVEDGFGSTKALVEQYETDTDAFMSYLKSLNKAFGSNPNQNERIYFSPPLMSRFLGALYYCSVCYHNLHLIEQ